MARLLTGIFKVFMVFDEQFEVFGQVGIVE